MMLNPSVANTEGKLALAAVQTEVARQLDISVVGFQQVVYIVAMFSRRRNGCKIEEVVIVLI